MKKNKLQYFQFLFIKICRYILKIKYLRIMSGPLKGLRWTTNMNYEYLTGTFITKPEINTLQKILRNEQSVFYDIGANVGYFSIMAETLIPGCQVYAFEPIPQHLHQLESHLKINNIKNVNVFQYAVSNTSGEINFSNHDNSEGNTYIKESPLYKESNSILKVKCISIDDFIKEGKPYPNLLKIDVEGAEFDVLKGGEETIKNFKPAIILSTHDLHLPGIKDKCLNFLQQMNYQVTPTGSHKALPGLEDFIAIYKN